MIFFGRASACGILVPQSGIELIPPAVEARSLNHWSTREVPLNNILNNNILLGHAFKSKEERYTDYCRMPCES